MLKSKTVLFSRYNMSYYLEEMKPLALAKGPNPNLRKGPNSKMRKGPNPILQKGPNDDLLM